MANTVQRAFNGFRRKLYFDVSLGIGIVSQTFACTLSPTRAAFATGDRFGSLLAAYQPATASTPAQILRQNNVSAWFQPVTGQQGVGTASGSLIEVFFINWTAAVSNTTQGCSQGALGSTIAGSSPLALQEFSAKVRRAGAAGNSLTCQGTLFVQRQHSIEV